MAAIEVSAKRAEKAFFPMMAWDYAKDEATLKEMEQCGVNMVAFVPKEMLDLCRKHHLKAIVFDESICGNDWTKPFDAERALKNLPALIKEVNKHPAVYGYHLQDEPSEAGFEALGKASAVVRELAPDKWPYINLFPGWGPAYDSYLDNFITACKPPILSYDNYGVAMEIGNADGYWMNVAQARKAALKHNIPFWVILLTAPHWQYREITAADINLQIYGALAYGAMGLSFYKFNSESLPILDAPDLGNFRMGPLSPFGDRTQTWYHLRDSIRQVNNLAPVLLELKSDDVYHVGKVPGENHGPDEKSLVRKVYEGGDFIVGEFSHQDGSRWLMIVNKSQTASYPCNPEFAIQPKRVEYISAITGKLARFPMPYFWLAPGQGVLLKVTF